RIGSAEVGGELNPVDPGEIEVRQDNVGAEEGVCLDCLHRIGDLSDDVDVRFDLAQEPDETGADDRILVDEQQSPAELGGVHRFRADVGNLCPHTGSPVRGRVNIERPAE